MQQERALGCLLGGAVGDAFGYTIEFDRLAAIRARFGPAGLREPVLQDGRLVVSDDTQMTLFTLEALLRALEAGCLPSQEVLAEIRRGYLDWLYTQGQGGAGYAPAGALAAEPVLRVLRAPGNTCLGALRAGGSGTLARPINRSKGCGGAMRVAPIGLFPGRLGVAEAFRLAAEAAALTHGHPSGYLSAGMVAGIVRCLADGMDLAEAARRCSVLLQSWDGHEETLQAVHAALDLAARGEAAHTDAVRALGEGWVGEEALAIALYAALAGATFPEVMAIAANHDGDSDSTASIAGQLWGAWRGLEGIPHRWIQALDVLAPLLRLARRWRRLLE